MRFQIRLPSLCLCASVVFSFCPLVASLTLAAEDWPGWRGPSRSGIAPDGQAPLHWTADASTETGIAWKVALPGSGSSQPIVWQDRIILTAAEGPQQSDLHILCLAARSGERLWDLRLWGTSPTLYHATKSSMATPTPITDGRHVYAFFGTGDVFCVDLSGKLLWQRSLASEYGPFENRFAASSSPLLFGDLLLLQCDHYGPSYLLALDKHSGANRWKVDRPEAWLSWSSPQLFGAPPQGKENNAEPELVVCGSEKVEAFRPSNGEKLWSLGGMARECIPTPVLGGGLIYAVSGPRGTTLAIRPGGRGDVSRTHVAWTSTKGTPFVPSAILVGDYYYLVDDHGIATCLEAKSGELKWRKRLGGNVTASPVAAGGRIYFITESGETVVLEGGVPDYHELARNSLNQAVYASPAIAGGRLYVRTPSHLVCISGNVDQ